MECFLIITHEYDVLIFKKSNQIKTNELQKETHNFIYDIHCNKSFDKLRL